MALTNLKRVRMGLVVAIAFCWALMPVLIFTQDTIPALGNIAVIISFVGVVIGGGIWFSLGNLEQKFYRGKEITPRNLPEK